MRWNRPNYGELKILKKFAFFPVVIYHGNPNVTNGTTVWLESYFEVVIYGRFSWHHEENFLTLEEAQAYVNNHKN